MSKVEVICPRCMQWRVEDLPEEQITTATMDGNSIAIMCSKQCSDDQDRIDREIEEFYGLR